MLRRVSLVALVVVALGTVLVFQATRPDRAASDARVFVPSPSFYRDFSNSFRTSVADAYWLYMIQYYGEHLKTDRRFDSLPAMTELVTDLSPRFKQAYFTGAFALLDYGRPDLSYDLLSKGFKRNPDDWHFPFYLGIIVYTYADNANKRLIAARFLEQAAVLPGRPNFVPRLAAQLYTRGDDREKAIELWTQVYADGDKHMKEKAVAQLDKLLPRDKTVRMKAVAGLRQMLSPDIFQQFVLELFRGYE